MNSRTATIIFSLMGTLLLGLPVAALPGAESGPFRVVSPDGNLAITLGLESKPQPFFAGERLYYRVEYKGIPVLSDSPLGLDFKGASALDRDFEILGARRDSSDTAWETVVGARKKVRDHYNETTVALREREGLKRRLDVVLRAYDEGVAFRYVLPEQDAIGKFIISAENTGFCFPGPAVAYALNLGRFTSPYEGEFLPVGLDRIKTTSLVGLPLLVSLPGGPWAAILEADLTDYAGMYLGAAPGIANALISRLSPLPKRSDEAVVGSTPLSTPWRVIMVGDRPARMIEANDLILNLNPPCALADTSWIKPGKTGLFWWLGSYPYPVNFTPGINTETFRHFIDFSSSHKFEYMLFDDGWSAHEDITRPLGGVDMAAIVEYGRKRGVRVILWMPWTAVAKQMDEAFALYEKWGVAGIKVDFMDRDDQEMIRFYQRTIRKAAEHHLIVDFHGAYKPTGLARTYPNLIVQEAVMGLEYSLWSDRTNPEHDVTIPFTRMLAGHLDYAPGSFFNATKRDFRPRESEPMAQGTRAHHLALYVVFEAPLAMVWGYPEAYVDQPGIDFLETVPTTWDETRVISGEVGDEIVIARRNGRAWYLGGLTDWTPRQMEIPLTFLGPGTYEARIFADGPDADVKATSLTITKSRVNSKGSLKVRMAPGGGVAVILTPAAR
jgi:alpha-glucosidase